MKPSIGHHSSTVMESMTKARTERQTIIFFQAEEVFSVCLFDDEVFAFFYCLVDILLLRACAPNEMPARLHHGECP